MNDRIRQRLMLSTHQLEDLLNREVKWDGRNFGGYNHVASFFIKNISLSFHFKYFPSYLDIETGILWTELLLPAERPKLKEMLAQAVDCPVEQIIYARDRVYRTQVAFPEFKSPMTDEDYLVRAKIGVIVTLQIAEALKASGLLV